MKNVAKTQQDVLKEAVANEKAKMALATQHTLNQAQIAKKNTEDKANLKAQATMAGAQLASQASKNNVGNEE